MKQPSPILLLTATLQIWTLAPFIATVVEAAETTADSQTDGQILLRYKFQMGEVLRYQVEHTADVRTTIEETTQQVKSNSESIKAWKVTDVLP